MNAHRPRNEKVKTKAGFLNLRSRVVCRIIASFALVHAVTQVGYFSQQSVVPHGLQNESSETKNLARSMTVELGVGNAALLSTDVEAEESRPAQYRRKGNAKIINYEGLDGVTKLMQQFWAGKLLCNIAQIRSKASNKKLPIFLNVTFGCRDLYENGRLGTGNYIMLFYGIRVVARIFGDVDVSFACSDADETKKLFVTPWLMGMFPGRPINEKSEIPITSQQMCARYSMPPLTYIHKGIQHDIRKMAIGLLGIPRHDHPSAMFAERSLWNQSISSTQISTWGLSQIPIPQKYDVPSFAANEYELDDAVLHFRCGDLMDSVHPGFAFLKFNGYVRHISPEASTIGIITQPFDAGTQSRALDMNDYKRDRCRTVVYSLVKYIEERHPNAKVSIRNDIDETIALSFARMTMANQTINGISTFSIMPTIATFGTGYVRTPDGNMQNQWLKKPRIDLHADNVVLFDEPNVIMVGDMKKLWENKGEAGVLEWFQNDSSVYVSQN